MGRRHSGQAVHGPHGSLTKKIFIIICVFLLPILMMATSARNTEFGRTCLIFWACKVYIIKKYIIHRPKGSEDNILSSSARSCTGPRVEFTGGNCPLAKQSKASKWRTASAWLKTVNCAELSIVQSGRLWWVVGRHPHPAPTVSDLNPSLECCLPARPANG